MREARKQMNTMFFSLLPPKLPGAKDVDLFGISAKTTNLFLGKTRLLADALKNLKRQKYTVVMLVNSEERAQRLRQGLWDLGVEASLVREDLVLHAGKIYLLTGYLTSGFELLLETGCFYGT